MMITESTPKADLLDAIYGDEALFEYFLNKNMDPEFMTQKELLDVIVYWIESADECAGCA